MRSASEPDVVLVSCTRLPEPDHDAEPLLEALRQRGVSADIWSWDDKQLDWSCPRLAVIRSTWNYASVVEDFLAWARHVDSVSTLLNPLEVICWNVHKRYLGRLDAAGIHTVPTEFVERGEQQVSLASIMATNGWERAVIKPEVSAGSANTHVVSGGGSDDVLFKELVRDREMMVQPYIESVDGYGERSLVWIDGVISHAIRKTPRFADDEESVSGALPVADDEHSLATAVLETVKTPLLYARVDIARDEDGLPMIMELELVEPSLFLLQSPSALDCFAESITARLKRARRS